MREFMRIVESFGAYGLDHFWIKPDGKVQQVEDHHSSASAMFGNDEFTDDEDHDHTSAVRSAMAEGWIRANYGGATFIVFSATWEPGRASDRAFKGLRRLIGGLPEANEYRVGGQIFQTRRDTLEFLA